MTRQQPLRVVVAGAGVAGLETVLALRALAESRVTIDVVSPEREFAYRPLATAEPFGAGETERFDLEALIASGGARLVEGVIEEVDPEQATATTSAGAERGFDVLVVTCGAKLVDAVPGSLTFRGPDDLLPFKRVLDDLIAGAARRVAFVLPGGAGWPLPLYELTLGTAVHLAAAGVDGEVVVITPEESPLGLFGDAASRAVAQLLAERGVEVVTRAYAVAAGPDGVELAGGANVAADRVVALPRLLGPAMAGLPHDAEGFIPTDLHGAVIGVDRIYAAGDATAFPVKQGGIATQQADAVAEAVAHLAGAPVTPSPFTPVLRGLLLTGGAPRYLRSELTGGRGETSTVTLDAMWWPPGKIVGRYLGPFLAEYLIEPLPEPPRGRAVAVEIELET